MKETNNWLNVLNEEDVGFILRFVLASGSLKQLAKEYDVSYPTVRARLNRLIEKITIYQDQTAGSEFEKVLRAAYAEGAVSRTMMKTLLDVHRKEIGHED